MLQDHDGAPPLHKRANTPSSCPGLQAAREAACEKLFSELYTLLARVEDSLSQTKGEIYIWHGYGRYIFMPGVHWFPVKGRWAVPQAEMKQLILCLRRVARMLWTLLLDFQEGFDEVRWGLGRGGGGGGDAWPASNRVTLSPPPPAPWRASRW